MFFNQAIFEVVLQLVTSKQSKLLLLLLEELGKGWIWLMENLGDKV